MSNEEIAQRLDQAAILLEIEEAGFFRVQAYRNAAITARECPDAIAERVARGEDLSDLEAIGRDLSAAITALVRDGELPVLAASETPLGLLELVRLPGLGPGRARKLWRGLGVTSLDELESALHEGLVRRLEGFGPKTEETLLRRLERLREREAGSSPE